MHKKFLKYLVDPTTKEPLSYQGPKLVNNIINEGYLVSATGKYPIIRGIPRFVPKENYTQSFGWQWNNWAKVQFDSENIGKPMEGYTKNMWSKICGLESQFNASQLDKKIILDIGCGPGRFIESTRNKGALVIGIDYSNAVEAAANNFKLDHDVCIIQGDALNLPFLEAVFDGAFSIGVLHHTPNPARGVDQAYKVIKKGGWLAISVYGIKGYYKYPNVQIWRKIFATLWPIFGYRPALLYTYVTVSVFGPISKISRSLGRIFKIPFPFISLPDKNWSLLDTFDSITPSHQSGHEPYEVFSWFKNSGFKNIEPTNWGNTSWKGIK